MQSLLSYCFNFSKSLFYLFDHPSILVLFGKFHGFDIFENGVMIFFLKFKSFFGLPYSALTSNWPQFMLYFPSKKYLFISYGAVHLAVLQYQSFSGLIVICNYMFSLAEFFQL